MPYSTKEAKSEYAKLYYARNRSELLAKDRDKRIAFRATHPIKEKPFRDLTGLTFFHLTVLSHARRDRYGHHWNVTCECGAEKVCRGGNLTTGKIKSCGNVRNGVHGPSRDLPTNERRRISAARRIAHLSDDENKARKAKAALKERKRWAKENPKKVAKTNGQKVKIHCINCLYRCGLGSTRIARLIGEKTEWVKVRLKSMRGIDRHPVFKSSRNNKRNVKFVGTINEMHRRAKRCIETIRLVPYGMDTTEAFRWRYRNDYGFRMLQLCRRRARKLLAGVKKSGSCTNLVGCTSEHLRQHIEAQFTKGMNWSNNGTGAGKWNLDHIIPCAAFDLTREDQQRICFHWTNLRPMWSLDNIKKRDKLLRHETPCFAM